MLALINSQAQFPLKVSALDYESAMQRFCNALEGVESDRKEQIQAILADENISRLIEGIFGTSPYLSMLMHRNVEFVAELFSKDPATLLASLIAEVGTAEIDDLEKIKKHLRVMKGKVALCAAVADLAGVWNLGSVTGALSSFADSAVKAAVSFLIRKAAREGLIKIQSRYDPAGSSGLGSYARKRAVPLWMRGATGSQVCRARCGSRSLPPPAEPCFSAASSPAWIHRVCMW